MTNTSTWHTSISDAIKVPIEKGRQSAFIFEDKDMQVRFIHTSRKMDKHHIIKMKFMLQPKVVENL